jgi:hypothetical protein
MKSNKIIETKPASEKTITAKPTSAKTPKPQKKRERKSNEQKIADNLLRLMDMRESGKTNTDKYLAMCLRTGDLVSARK